MKSSSEQSPSVVSTPEDTSSAADCQVLKSPKGAALPKITRQFMRYTAEQRTNRMASHKLGHRAKETVGEYFYTRDDVPNIAFATRKQAAEHEGLNK